MLAGSGSWARLCFQSSKVVCTSRELGLSSPGGDCSPPGKGSDGTDASLRFRTWSWELKIELSRDKASFAGARSGAVGAVKRRWCPAFSWLSRTAPRHADLTGFGKISEVRNVVIGMLFCVLYN